MRYLLCLLLAVSPLQAGDWKPSDGDVCHEASGFFERLDGGRHCHYTEETLARKRREAQKKAEKKAEKERREEAWTFIGLGVAALIYLVIVDNKEDKKPEKEKKVFVSPEESRPGIRINFSLPIK